MPIEGLDQPCSVCERPSGDHTLREWAACIGTVTTDLPYEQTPPDAAAVVAEKVRQQFNLDEDLIVADHVVIRAATLDGASGQVRVRIPALIHEFQVGVSGQPPVTVAKVVYVADTDGMRAYGRLARDTANGAANAAELERARPEDA